MIAKSLEAKHAVLKQALKDNENLISTQRKIKNPKTRATYEYGATVTKKKRK